jgi:hypothetical protein
MYCLKYVLKNMSLLVSNPARCYGKCNKDVVCNFIICKDTFVVDDTM